MIGRHAHTGRAVDETLLAMLLLHVLQPLRIDPSFSACPSPASLVLAKAEGECAVLDAEGGIEILPLEGLRKIDHLLHLAILGEGELL